MLIDSSIFNGRSTANGYASETMSNNCMDALNDSSVVEGNILAKIMGVKEIDLELIFRVAEKHHFGEDHEWMNFFSAVTLQNDPKEVKAAVKAVKDEIRRMKNIAWEDVLTEGLMIWVETFGNGKGSFEPAESLKIEYKIPLKKRFGRQFQIKTFGKEYFENPAI